MTLHELMDYAQNHDTEDVRFRACDNQGVKTDVTFVVLDPYYKLIGYDKRENAFVTIPQLEELCQTGQPLQVELIQDGGAPHA